MRRQVSADFGRDAGRRIYEKDVMANGPQPADHAPLLQETAMADVDPVVFVVDDDLSVRDSLALLVESAGWQPETFGSGQ